MAVLKKSELEKINSSAAVNSKIRELEMSMLELKAEGKPDKVRPLKKAIARLLVLSKTLNTKKAK